MGGVTISYAQGQGTADPPLVGQYFSRDYVVTIMADSKVDPVLNSISDTACTSTKDDGKVFVTNVEDALDLCTKKRGTKAI